MQSSADMDGSPALYRVFPGLLGAFSGVVENHLNEPERRL